MNVFIHGHETMVQARWREHIFDRMSKLDRFEDRIVRIEYILTSSHHHLKGNETCHIIVKIPRKTLNIKKSAQTMPEAIDLASKVMEGQVHKLYKDVKDRNRRALRAKGSKRAI